MINDLRATGADPQLISYTTLYWENYYTVMQLLRNITHKYESQVKNGPSTVIAKWNCDVMVNIYKLLSDL